MHKLDLFAAGPDDGDRLDRFVARRGDISRGEARRLLDRGAVWVNQQRVKIASRPVRAGQRILVVMEEAGRTVPPEMELDPTRVLFQDAHLIAVDKPAFVPAQATLASDRGSLVALVSAHVGRPVGLVHRLDLETTGVTVFGKTKAATTALAAAFREGKARKRYLAVCWGDLPGEGRVDLPLCPDPRHPGRFLARVDGKLPAATRFRVLGREERLLVVEVFPETGRTHQIRVHLASLEAPIIGDELYGGPSALEGPRGEQKVERFLLHARSLDLPHPATGAAFHVEALVPPVIHGAALRAGVNESAL